MVTFVIYWPKDSPELREAIACEYLHNENRHLTGRLAIEAQERRKVEAERYDAKLHLSKVLSQEEDLEEALQDRDLLLADARHQVAVALAAQTRAGKCSLLMRLYERLIGFD